MTYLKYRFKWLTTLSPMILLFIQDAHADFIKDSEASLQFKNFYMDRYYENDARPSMANWSQSVSARFNSGYTDTPIQVGFDFLGQYAIRLNDHDDSTKNNIMPYDEEKKRIDRSYGKLGLTLKLKYQDTEVKIGELEPKMPVVHIDETRQLTTVFSGVLLENKSFDDLKITAGFINRVKARLKEMGAYRRLLGDLLKKLPASASSRSYVVMEEIKESLYLKVD